MKTLPTERKQDAFEVGNVTTDLLLPLDRCHRRSLSEDVRLDRGGWVGEAGRAGALRQGCRGPPKEG